MGWDNRITGGVAPAGSLLLGIWKLVLNGMPVPLNIVGRRRWAIIGGVEKHKRLVEATVHNVLQVMHIAAAQRHLRGVTVIRRDGKGHGMEGNEQAQAGLERGVRSH